jgi:hypothetical protein
MAIAILPLFNPHRVFHKKNFMMLFSLIFMHLLFHNVASVGRLLSILHLYLVYLLFIG